MASSGALSTARRILLALEVGQSQGSLKSQAADCAPIVEALGYYDLADHLRRLDRGRSETHGPAVGGSESRVAPGQPADGERSAPPTDLGADSDIRGES